MILSAPVVTQIHACWDAIASLDVSKPEAALTSALSELSGLVRAQNAFWLGVVRLPAPAADPIRGWRPRGLVYLKPNEIDLAFARKTTKAFDAGQVDPSARANASQAGVFRARLHRELVPPAWYGSDAYDVHHRMRGIRDVVYVATPINRDAESYFGFHRKGRHRPFTEGHRDLLAHVIRPLGNFQRQVMLGYGLAIAQAPLTPAERRVLSALLGGESEKEIADRLSLTVRSAHAYVTDVFRKFGVTSRAGLMALWIGRSQK